MGPTRTGDDEALGRGPDSTCGGLVWDFCNLDPSTLGGSWEREGQKVCRPGKRLSKMPATPRSSGAVSDRRASRPEAQCADESKGVAHDGGTRSHVLERAGRYPDEGPHRSPDGDVKSWCGLRQTAPASPIRVLLTSAHTGQSIAERLDWRLRTDRQGCCQATPQCSGCHDALPRAFGQRVEGNGSKTGGR